MASAAVTSCPTCWPTSQAARDGCAPRASVTDLDSQLVRDMSGWLQGYNAQAACNERHIIVAAEVMTASSDFGQLAPMLTAARQELAAAGVTEQPDVVLADAGYWHLEQIN